VLTETIELNKLIELSLVLVDLIKLEIMLINVKHVKNEKNLMLGEMHVNVMIDVVE